MNLKSIHNGLIGLIGLVLSSTMLHAAPTLTTTEPEPSAVVPALRTIKVTFSEPVTGIDASDLVINAEAAAGVKGSGQGPYEFTFTQPLPGDVSVSWDFDHGIAGVSGSGAYAPDSGWTYQLMDTLPPSIGTVREGQNLESIVPLPGSTVKNLTQVEVRFSEVVTGIDAGDLQMNGQVSADFVSGEGAGPYIFSFPEEPTPGQVTFDWVPTPGIVDLAGNSFDASKGWSVTLAPETRGEIQITEFMAANASGLTDSDDDTSDWIELYNPSPESVDLAGWSLTTDPDRPDLWVMPSKSLGSGKRLVIFASGKDTNSIFGKPHTNFTLDLSGGYLALYGPESPREVVSAFTDYPAQRIDFSYGITPAGEARYFAEPTPESENSATGLTEVTAQPSVSVSRGFFAEPFTVIISSSDSSATIRYTLNGSEPTATSPEYSQPLSIASTTVLRVAAFAPDKVSSATVTHSYIFLDQVLSQPSPPYDNPERNDDNDNPPLPTVGDATFPITWGSQSGAGFPGEIDNLPNNAAPADYGMDPEIIDDPNKYNDDGEIDNANGITNRERMERAFRELPLMSVVMENDDMFGPEGLHPNSTQKGVRYEFPCSVELLLPDGTTGFDTTCGIRMHGNASREPRKCPKHGYKLNFKSTFGASRLAYALFPDSPSTEFDDIILRGDFNSSWLHWDGGQQRPRGTRMRDAFSKDTFRDMGRAAGHSRYVHLFINGIYWGLYDPTEQENNGYAANTFGGSKDDYDVVEQGTLKSGSMDAYNAMRGISSPITNEKYEEMKSYLDVPWYADYMLLHFFLGHQDWGDNIDKNWYSVRHKDGQFRYLPWDMENLMWDEDVNRVTVGSPPTGLHTKLTSNDQYLLDFADRVHKHLVAPDGALRPENNIARWNKWRAVIQNAIACEAARWGDYRRDVHQHQSGPFPLFTWTDHWIVEQQRLTETWFPKRPDIVLKQLRDEGLYPTVQAPEFKDSERNTIGSQRVAAGFELTIAKASVFAGGTLYYTTDGSDPRVYFDTTGALTPTAQRYSTPILINESTVVKARSLDRSKWSALMEATFTVGSPDLGIRISEIHYNAKGSLGGSAAEFVELQNTSGVAVDLGKWSFQGIDFVFPWGTIVGPGDRLVIASNDAPSIFHAQHPGVTVVGYYGGRLDNDGERITLLNGQGNLASSVEYSDKAPWPASADNEGSSLEMIETSGDPQSPYNWKASERINGTPGLANSGREVLIIIREFLAKSSEDADFVELQNLTTVDVDLGGWQLVPPAAEDTVTLSQGTVLASGATLSIPLPLPPSWGNVSLINASGGVVDGVRYGMQATDLSFRRSGSTWQLSEPAESANLTDLRLNEWLANPSPGFDDWVELINTNASHPVVLTGLHARVNGELFVVQAPAAVEAGGVVRLYADRGARRADALLFQLPAKGGTLSLGDAHGDVFDSVTYGPQAQGVSVGRLPDGTGDVVSLDFPSPGVPNQVSGADGVQLNEILIGSAGWIEITASEDVDLEGWLLRTVSNSPQSWAFDGTSIAAGSYQLVSAPLPIDSSYNHWGVELVNPLGQVVDRVTWGWQIPNQSIGRIADGTWTLLATTTPEAPNEAAATLGSVSMLRINEWFAAGANTTLKDSFLELYNPSAQPIALSGLWLGDEPSERGRQKWRVPELSFIAPQSYAVFQAGSGTSKPTTFLFDIARGGEYLRLGGGENAAETIDAQGFGQQASLTQSQGRLPDGADSVTNLTPTPGSANTDQLPEGKTFADWAAENNVSDPKGDDDGDGLLNIIEFLTGSDPNIVATAAEREATRENVHIRDVNGTKYISIELSIDRTASYTDLVGELSPNLQAPWSATQPTAMEVLEDTALGTQKVRFEFAAPANDSVHFLRLRIEP